MRVNSKKILAIIASFSIIIIITTIILASIVSSSTIEEKDLLNYTNEEISFKYPNTWRIISENPNGNDSANNIHTISNENSNIITFYDEQNNMSIAINRQITPNNYSINNSMAIMENNNLNLNNTLLITSKTQRDINGMIISEINYKSSISNNNGTNDDNNIERRESWIEMNGAIYSIIYTKNISNSENGDNITDTNNSKKINSDDAYNSVIDNLEIRNESLRTDNPYIGKIIIPKLNKSLNIRTDTVNAYDSVYHYNDSYYTGESGAVGILGHHTKYSAPFDDLNTLEENDTVIIKDYLSQKTYTYSLAKNGDIKSDYKENPVEFEEGSPILKLVTCWPEGTDNEAWITSFDLSGISGI